MSCSSVKSSHSGPLLLLMAEISNKLSFHVPRETLLHHTLCPLILLTVPTKLEARSSVAIISPGNLKKEAPCLFPGSDSDINQRPLLVIFSTNRESGERRRVWVGRGVLWAGLINQGDGRQRQIRSEGKQVNLSLPSRTPRSVDLPGL